MLKRTTTLLPAIVWGLASAITMASTIASEPPPAPKLATPDQLKAMRDSGDYRVCLQQIGKAQRYAGQLGRNQATWDPVIRDCRAIMRKAKGVLEAE